MQEKQKTNVIYKVPTIKCEGNRTATNIIKLRQGTVVQFK
jgi:hypothetical protein